MFAGKKSAQIREILISESAWEEMTCLFAPSLGLGPFRVLLFSGSSTDSSAGFSTDSCVGVVVAAAAAAAVAVESS
ncbi:TPA: hypothetical protein MIT69_22835 [Klebsiella pneumoniae]|nr:hypothetical protein [Salmonella enterica subsp. enterica]EDV0510868.1 hypothetical protein [Salmonella enterica subsp. enterica serovar Mbandaka]EEA2533593.1 hypothetical protein [Salmonella enterica subsp. enterica serovar Schwarzengrund]HBY4076591.1 hypothetical protein [Klebsiella pneumoniae]